MKGFDDVDCTDFFTVSTTGLRGHSLKLFKSLFNTNCGKYVLAIELLMSGICYLKI